MPSRNRPRGKQASCATTTSQVNRQERRRVAREKRKPKGPRIKYVIEAGSSVLWTYAGREMYGGWTRANTRIASGSVRWDGDWAVLLLEDGIEVRARKEDVTREAPGGAAPGTQGQRTRLDEALAAAERLQRNQ